MLGIQEYDEIEYPIDELTVFVDPLDATRAFTDGKMEAVTTLITLVHNNEPIAAAIGEPYQTREKFRPSVYIGARGLNKVFQFESKGFYEHQLIKEYLPFKPYNYQENEFKGFLSTSHYDSTIEPLLSLLPNIVRIKKSGCGAKAVGLLNQEGDVCLYSTAGSSRWDIGPMTIFMEILGGNVSGIRGEKYLYDKNGTTNLFGLLATTSKHASEDIARKFHEYLCSIGKGEGPLLGNEINKEV